MHLPKQTSHGELPPSAGSVAAEDRPALRVPRAGRANCHTAGFSLVEITLAIGILSFALIPLFSLLPLGMQVYQEAVDTTVRTEIVQTITNLVGQTNFNDLDGGKNGAPVAAKLDADLTSALARLSASPVYFYFDDEGVQISNPKEAIYTAALSYRVPPPAGSANLPGNSTSANFATLWMDIYNTRGMPVGAVAAGKSKTYVLHMANSGKRF